MKEVKEILRGFKRGLVLCAMLSIGIAVVALVKIIEEAYQHIYDPSDGAMF